MTIFEADSLKFNFKEKIGRVDYIMTSPPSFQENELTIDQKFKGISPFGNTPEQHTSNLLIFLKKLAVDTGCRLLIAQFTESDFVKCNKNKATLFREVGTWQKRPGSPWSTMNDRDVYTIMSKYFRNSENSIFLDPFCGTGVILKCAESLGMTCYGVDISQEQLNLCQVS